MGRRLRIWLCLTLTSRACNAFSALQWRNIRRSRHTAVECQYGVSSTVFRRLKTRSSATAASVAAAAAAAAAAATTSPSTSSEKTIPKKTFDRWLEVEAWRQPALSDVQPVMASIASACQRISGLVRRANVDGMAGLATSGLEGAVEVNVQGEEQKRLDVVTNDLLKTWLCSSGSLYCVASEEEDSPCTCASVVGNLAAFDGDLVAMFDPLDGSSNVESGLATGTIFAILRQPSHLSGASPATLLQRGAKLVAAGYCLYGAATTLVCSLGHGVQGFTLDNRKGKFVLTHPDLRIPRRGRAVMFNQANFASWDEGVKRYITAVRAESFQARLMAEAAAAEVTAAALLTAEAVEESPLVGDGEVDGRTIAVVEAAAAIGVAAAEAAVESEVASALAEAAAEGGEAGEGIAGGQADEEEQEVVEGGRKWAFEYSGAFVGDVHALLTQGGGLFGYPADAKNKDGKLRLLYESNPMAFLIEQAGGAATTGKQRILEVVPSAVHQRVPTFMGSADDVYDLSIYLAESAAGTSD